MLLPKGSELRFFKPCS
uniref:Uncharacterized protein n=1 Tax=Anguilla anguilla TaxID=7936 RepID=A0A0E9QBF1_ANGAN